MGLHGSSRDHRCRNHAGGGWEPGSAASGARLVTLEPGHELIRRDEAADEMITVADGVLRTVIREEDGSEHVVKQMPTGDVIGEIALLAGGCRAGTVPASSRRS